MKNFAVCLALIAGFATADDAAAFVSCDGERTKDCFKGQLILDPYPQDAELKVLRQNFAYIDPDGIGWETSAGDVTDGASIPKLLRPIVGEAFDKQFIAAAVIHDHYCDDKNQHRVRDWRQTHRVFYHGLVNQKVPPTKAKLMYYAVYTFGPRWGFLYSPKPCSLVRGSTCIKSTEGSYSLESKEADYELEGAEKELELIEAALDAKNGELTLVELEAISDSVHANDRFLNALIKEPKEGSGPVFTR